MTTTAAPVEWVLIDSDQHLCIDAGYHQDRRTSHSEAECIHNDPDYTDTDQEPQP